MIPFWQKQTGQVNDIGGALAPLFSGQPFGRKKKKYPIDPLMPTDIQSIGDQTGTRQRRLPGVQSVLSAFSQTLG